MPLAMPADNVINKLHNNSVFVTYFDILIHIQTRIYHIYYILESLCYFISRQSPGVITSVSFLTEYSIYKIDCHITFNFC